MELLKFNSKKEKGKEKRKTDAKGMPILSELTKDDDDGHKIPETLKNKI
tara:strand:+ start:501 stop:647 length:147 start_codon:yes stop_codon:yes gene_type:complete